MKNFSKWFGITALALVIGVLTISCNKKSQQTTDGGRIALAAPANVSIDVSGRIMTVSWDTMENASGYQVVTTSVGCASGNRTVDTKENTAVITSNGNKAANVAIAGDTTIQITLMAARGDPNSAMASAVTAKVMSLGGTVAKNVYVDSDYSEVVNKTIDK